MEGWIDVLEPYEPEEIRRAWAEYQKSGPRSERGALYRPDAGAIARIIDRRRRNSRLASQEPQLIRGMGDPYVERQPRSQEEIDRVREMIAAAGFGKCLGQPSGKGAA